MRARTLFAAIGSSDAGLLAVVACLLLTAGVCRVFMGRADPVPDDKTVISICRPGYKRDREEMRELKAAFEHRHPETYLKVIRSNLERKQDTMIAAGVSPDLVTVVVDRAEHYISAGALLDLTPFVESVPELHQQLFGSPDGEQADFYAQTVAPFVRLDEQGRRHIYALPINYTPFVIFYSKDLFDRYQVPYPDENWDWDGLRSRALALTRDEQGRRPDQPGFDSRHIKQYGFQLAPWQHGPENFIRQAGGRLVSEDGARMAADDARTVEALQFLYDLKHRDHVVPDTVPSAGGVSRDVKFTGGDVAMFLYGVFAIPTIRDEAPQMDWDVAPLPRGPRGQRGSVIATNALGIAAESQNPQAAFEYLRFLVGDEGLDIVGRHQVFLPCRRSVMRRTVLADTAHKPASKWALTHDMDNGYGEPPFATRQCYDDVYACVNEYLEKLFQLPESPFTPQEAAAAITREGNRILHRDRAVGNAASFGTAVLLLAAIPAVYAVYRVIRRRGRPQPRLVASEERWGLLLISPWLLGFLVFAAFPIVVSIGLSFSQWQSLSHFTHSEFIGIENYRVALSGEDPKFWTSLWVTFRYALLAVPAGLVVGLAMAVLMNQAVRGIAVFRTLYYLPAVLPSVAAAVLWWHLFDADHGWINLVVGWLNVGGWIEHACRWCGSEYPVGWLLDGRVTPYVFVAMSLWVVGGSMIIYLAGLQGIPTTLYEAAEIDGANRWRRFRHVTVPMLSPVILFNLIMGIIGSFQVFNVAFVLFDGATGPRDSALFYGLHLFREAFTKYRLGYASALAWILFVIVLVLTALVFKSSPLWVHYEARRSRRA